MFCKRTQRTYYISRPSEMSLVRGSLASLGNSVVARNDDRRNSHRVHIISAVRMWRTQETGKLVALNHQKPGIRSEKFNTA